MLSWHQQFSSFGSKRGLTLPSRGRPTSGFASCRPPLMSNVRPPERECNASPSKESWRICESHRCRSHARGHSRQAALPCRAAVRYGRSGLAPAANRCARSKFSAVHPAQRAVHRQAVASKPLARLGARCAGEYLRRGAEVGGAPTNRQRSPQGSARPCPGSAVAEAQARGHQALAHGNLQRRPCAFGWRSRTLEAMNTKVSRSLSSKARTPSEWPNPSIEGTSNIWLRQLSAAPHVKR